MENLKINLLDSIYMTLIVILIIIRLVSLKNKELEILIGNYLSLFCSFLGTLCALHLAYIYFSLLSLNFIKTLSLVVILMIFVWKDFENDKMNLIIESKKNQIRGKKLEEKIVDGIDNIASNSNLLIAKNQGKNEIKYNIPDVDFMQHHNKIVIQD